MGTIFEEIRKNKNLLLRATVSDIENNGQEHSRDLWNCFYTMHT